MTLSERVRKRREELGLTQEELARRMGYSSRVSINKIEMGRPVSQKIIARLSEALDVSIPYLMGWEEKEEQPTGLGELSEREIEFIRTVRQLPDEVAEQFLGVLKTLLNKR